MTAQGYGEHPDAARVWQSKIRPLLRRSPGLRHMLQQNMIDAPVQTPSGIVLPGRRAIAFSPERIDRVVRRIVRGLLWHHYRQKPAADATLQVFQQQVLPQEVADMINTLTQLSWIGDTIFRYRHALVNGAPDSSIWALQFYAQTQFIVVVQGESFLIAERESRAADLCDGT
jgi:hypothetical protein